MNICVQEMMQIIECFSTKYCHAPPCPQVIMRMMDVCTNSEDLVRAWSKKMAPPLVTLLGAEPEVQYVALRNINLVVQKRPGILANEVKVRAVAGKEGGGGVLCGWFSVRPSKVKVRAAAVEKKGRQACGEGEESGNMGGGLRGSSHNLLHTLTSLCLLHVCAVPSGLLLQVQ